MTFVFDNTYARLPERFFARLPPTPVARPTMVRINRPLALALGLDQDALARPAGVAVLAGNALPTGADPLAMAYAGHQFGSFVPQLGDGRAILLGEVVAPEGERFDIQLKGAGRTPFSRAGDGRAGLGPVLREFIISEAMHGLGIPTTRSLAAVATGEPVYRETVLPGAVLTRVARSHVRVGTFQYFLVRDDVAALRQLADYVIERHYPDAVGANRPYRALLEGVVSRQAALVAQWLCVGFIHGVMNTDNMSIAGETIDYGPCAFMDVYHPGTVFSSIDHGGRYAFGNQPRIAQWNLARLAQCLLPLLDEDTDRALVEAQAAVDAFGAQFEAAYLAGLGRKIGLASAGPDDSDLIEALLTSMAEAGADHTNTFRALVTAETEPALFIDELGAAARGWLERWRSRLERETGTPSERAAVMRAANPAVIARNHRVEEALGAAAAGELAPLDDLLAALTSPFDDEPAFAAYRRPPAPHEVVRQTFCGT